MEAQFFAQENAQQQQDRCPLAVETVIKSTSWTCNSIVSIEDEATV